MAEYALVTAVMASLVVALDVDPRRRSSRRGFR